MAKGEFGGELMYEGWAARIGNDEVARLLRQNGKEERRHGERAQQAKALLTA
jgi:rubrerythrin